MTIQIDDNTKAKDLFDAAKRDGEVRVKLDSGEEYLIKPASAARSLRDLPTLGLNLTVDELVAIVREGRERDYYPFKS